MIARRTALTVLFACGCSIATGALAQPAADPTTRVHSPDPLVRRGIDEARATLEDFLARARKPVPGSSGYAIRIAVEDGRELEHFWVTELQWTDDMFSGRLSGQPTRVKNVSPGQVVNFSRRQIVDWKYVDATGRMHGNYTAGGL